MVQQVLLRKIGLPPVVANAIQEKLRREQEAEQMKFVLQKEQQEAERKRIEAQGIADFQRIVAQGLNAQLLEWKGIEATEKLAGSSNAKVVVIGVPGLTWNDVKASPELTALVNQSHVGSISVKTAGPHTCPVDGWLTIR